ncbi:hypothetical protein PoB_007289400 [Plakobranchus ocellatus]|uniref:Uncharacterized protein n=1 Tax=Plakobranchus ocellatus TaxID=259542 RepID=A0AAV4DQA4_9GAST|nr:hypothetical protein PoB_007289400 [Plakobranchus ocellatus]
MPSEKRTEFCSAVLWTDTPKCSNFNHLFLQPLSAFYQYIKQKCNFKGNILGFLPHTGHFTLDEPGPQEQIEQQETLEPQEEREKQEPRGPQEQLEQQEHGDHRNNLSNRSTGTTRTS